MSVASAEYVFVTAAPLLGIGNEVTATEAAVRLWSVRPTQALAALGYDVRTVSLYREDSPAELVVRKAKRIVFGEMFAPAQGSAAGAYRGLLDKIDEPERRVLFTIAHERFLDAGVATFYREALPRCLAVTTVSEDLAASIRALTSRPVYVVPEPLEGPRGAPRACAARRPGRALLWLARRAGVSGELWRNRLLWFGYPGNLPPLLELVPELDKLAADYLLELVVVTSPVAELDGVLTPQRTGPQAPLRIRFVPWAPGVVEAMMSMSDLVLIPCAYRDPRRQAKSANRLLAALHGGRFALAHPIAAYEPYAPFAWVGEDLIGGLRWALRHPGEVTERVRRGQAFIDERHSDEAFARAWLAALRT